MKWVLVTHVIVTVYMLGLCWFVQIVHYPLFREIPKNEFDSYMSKNWITVYVTGPFMIVELITGLILLFHFSDLYHFINIGLLGITGFSTILIQIPIHIKLKKGYDKILIDQLVKTNWLRTVSWTLRTVLIGFLLFSYLNI